MKLSYLLLNVAITVGGLLLYHTVIASPDASPDAAPTPYERLENDYLSDLPEDEGPDPIILDSGADGALSRRNADKIATLEGLLAILKGRDGDAEGADPVFASPGGSSMPSLASGDLVDQENPVFDERTLQSLEVYLDEINRRKTEARNKERLENELTRLGVELSDDQREEVVGATLAYQTRARDLMRQGWSKDEGGRAKRKEAFAGLKDEYIATLHNLVPAAEAEKITSSRMSRAYGGLGSTRRATRRAGGNRGKNRGDK